MKDYFSIDRKTGFIDLKRSLRGANLNGVNLLVKCTNGIVSTTCNLKIELTKSKSIPGAGPKWIRPSSNGSNECTRIKEVYLFLLL